MRTPALAVFLTVLTTVVASATAPLIVTMNSHRITGHGETVSFDLENPGQEAAITHVFNIQGEEVAQLSALSLGRFVWDGKDINQQPVDSGMYVVQIRHGGAVWHGPVMINLQP